MTSSAHTIHNPGSDEAALLRACGFTEAEIAGILDVTLEVVQKRLEAAYASLEREVFNAD